MFAFFSWHVLLHHYQFSHSFSVKYIFNHLICKGSWKSISQVELVRCNRCAVVVWDSIQWDNTKFRQLLFRIQQTIIVQGSRFHIFLVGQAQQFFTATRRSLWWCNVVQRRYDVSTESFWNFKIAVVCYPLFEASNLRILLSIVIQNMMAFVICIFWNTCGILLVPVRVSDEWTIICMCRVQ